MNPVIVSKTSQKAPYPFGFEPTFHRYRLNDYIGKQSRNIFVCSMSDLFGEWVPDSWIDEVFAACEKAPQHNYLFLTKNPQRYNEYGMDAYTIPGIFNLWYGMSVTTEAQFDKTWLLPEYCNTFISIEPILEDLHTRDMDARFENLDWMIVGAETGIQKEKGVPKREWIEQIMESSRKYEIPLFMKSSLAQI